MFVAFLLFQIRGKRVPKQVKIICLLSMMGLGGGGVMRGNAVHVSRSHISDHGGL